MRQRTDPLDHSPTHRAPLQPAQYARLEAGWDPPVPVGEALQGVPLIAAEQFIGPFTGQHDLDGLRGQAG